MVHMVSLVFVAGFVCVYLPPACKVFWRSAKFSERFPFGVGVCFSTLWKPKRKVENQNTRGRRV